MPLNMKAIKHAAATAMQWLFRWITSSVPREDRRAAATLDMMKLKMHPAAAWRLGIVLLIGAIALMVALRGGGVELIAAILGGGALAVAYIEWLLGRRESSMDKFYERLVIANNYRREVKAPRGLRLSEVDLYVFSELDNLEYVIERYRFGYMGAALALRGVKTFQSRLENVEGFRARLPKLEDSGYSPHTVLVVNELIKNLEPSPSAAARRRGRIKKPMLME